MKKLQQLAPNHLTAIRASQSELVYLARGKEKHSGNQAWYYVQVGSRAKLPVFLQKIKTGINLSDYGTILYSGWGDEPPEDVRVKIIQQFG